MLAVFFGGYAAIGVIDGSSLRVGRFHGLRGSGPPRVLLPVHVPLVRAECFRSGSVEPKRIMGSQRVLGLAARPRNRQM